jgi:hypothetical protein
MAIAPKIEVVRRAYELWQQAGEPDGKDQEFYLQAEKELDEKEFGNIAREPPPTILPG